MIHTYVKQTIIPLTLLIIIMIANDVFGSPIIEPQKLYTKQVSNFEENKGQITGVDADRVKFSFNTENLMVFLLDNSIVYQFRNDQKYDSQKKQKKEDEYLGLYDYDQEYLTETYRMDLELVGANPNVSISAEGKSHDYTNYYNRGVMKVHNFTKVVYKNIYPHIDWVIYSSNNKIKYDFIVHPGGNLKDIQFKTKWVEKIEIDEIGNLILSNRLGSIIEEKPISFQGSNTIATKFIYINDVISFGVAAYDTQQCLTIDPLVDHWGTYYGGSGNEYGGTCVVDHESNVYLGGNTMSVTNISSGGYQQSLGGNIDAFLVKFNSNGQRLWATYYGGEGNDTASSSVIDQFNNVYIVGSTSSTSGIATSGSHQLSFGGQLDCFLAVFNSEGERLLGTYYGGSGEDRGLSCRLDGSGNIYIAGYTMSLSGIASGGHQNNHMGGGYDAFLVKLNSSGTRIWSTYYGNVGGDYGFTCDIDSNDDIYLAGMSSSDNMATSGSHQSIRMGNSEGFLVKFNANGVRQWATYYGGTGTEQIYGSFIDQSDNIYISGNSGSSQNISTSGSYQEVFADGFRDAFLAKFNSDGVRQWGTYYGGTELDMGTSCTVDVFGNVYLTGYTASTQGIASSNAYVQTSAGNTDCFLAKFTSDGQRLWGTYYGGPEGEDARYCEVDDFGRIFIAGYTSSELNIAYSGHQNTYGGGSNDAFLVRLEDCNTISYLTEIACENYYWPLSGLNYTESETYMHTIPNIAGCDSTIILKLIIKHPSFTEVTITECDSYLWSVSGESYTNSGIYTDTIDVGGCDSIVTLNLTLVNSSSSTIIESGCDSYLWEQNNQTYTFSGIYTDTIENMFGCDSIIFLDLTVNLSEEIVINQYALDSFTLNGQTYTQSGTYTQLLTTSEGCDSTIVLNLTIGYVGMDNLIGNSISVFPIPVSDYLFVKSSSEMLIEQYQLIDINGRIILSGLLQDSEQIIDTKSITPGFYILMINDMGGIRIIKQ